MNSRNKSWTRTRQSAERLTSTRGDGGRQVHRRAPDRRPPDGRAKNVLRSFSAVVLAGGESSRMGSDKAFLAYRGTLFIRLITDEMLKIADEVLVVVGDKDPEIFSRVLDERVEVVSDEYHLDNPMGGMLSAIKHLKNRYVAFLASDTPLMRSGVVRILYRSVVNNRASAAVPIWKSGMREPLCAVYRVKDVKSAGLNALEDGKIGCVNLISCLPGKVSYVDVSKLRSADPGLHSLINVNSRRELVTLENLNPV